MEAKSTENEHKSLKEVLFGENPKSGKAWAIFGTRVALGFIFLWAGIEKIETELGGRFATSGFLGHVAGPFAFLFTGMAGNPVVEYLLVWGELMIGISLVLGVFTRVGGISGAVMTALFYISTLPAMTATFQGSYLDFLMSKNALVSYYVVYVFIFVAFLFLVPGRFLGVDGVLRNLKFVQKRRTLNRIVNALG